MGEVSMGNGMTVYVQSPNYEQSTRFGAFIEMSTPQRGVDQIPGVSARPGVRIETDFNGEIIGVETFTEIAVE